MRMCRQAKNREVGALSPDSAFFYPSSSAWSIRITSLLILVGQPITFMMDPPSSLPTASPSVSSPYRSPPQANRLSLSPAVRISLATTSSVLLGLTMGVSYGSTRRGLLFRAENAHRLPTSPTGWYLYHKSKNYHMALGGMREGIKMGAKLGFWTFAFFGIEDSWDEIRGTRDAANTVLAALSVAGGWSLWSEY